MTFDTSYDRYKNYMLYDTFEGQVVSYLLKYLDDPMIRSLSE